jgi:hypothetical protein
MEDVMKKYIGLLLAIAAAVNVVAATGTTLNSQKLLKLWYDEPAPDSDQGWEMWSIPIGNGYMGVNVFGLTETERLQITENSLVNTKNPELGIKNGLTSFSETYIDFGHTYSGVSNYSRDLVLNDSTSHVRYNYNGVTYQREYFASYPDKVAVIKLSASGNGNVNFTLRPTIPFLSAIKTGTVVANGDTITLSGHLGGYKIDFEGQYKVIPLGGTLVPNANGTITVSGADSAVILISVGTNYQIDPQVFNWDADPLNSTKLLGFDHPHAKVTQRIADASAKTYEQLLANHKADYKSLFDRVAIDLGQEMPSDKTTDQLLSDYKAGTLSRYLEEMYFQFGRYLLICSSRKGTLPPNLQGVWNRHQTAPWSGGYWHNINIQMNYWPVFNTNLSELFDTYVDFYETYLPVVSKSAAGFIQSSHPNNYSESGNGWSIGTGISPYSAYAPKGAGVDGNGTGALMAKSFTEYYNFTQDSNVLNNISYPAVSGAASFMSRVMQPFDDKMLAVPSASPEQHVGGKTYVTKGTGWDQQLAYEMQKDALILAQAQNITSDPLIDRFRNQIDKLDPVVIGASGQVKEFREENYFGEIAEPQHRHISQLVGLFPGTIIDSGTPAWMDAAKTTLTLRGDKSTGWAMAHRLNLWARTKDGNRAFTLYKTLLQKGTLNNLWDTHPPFQIDGNFGGTAGVAEMLLQSHEGYIEPLAAMPVEWERGSYSGLLARGNFEVSAAWSQNQADKFIILSKSGRKCSVKYPNLSSAVVKTSGGAVVSFSASGTDLITFDTLQGETYSITGIPAHTIVTPASLLSVEDYGKNTKMKATWTASPDAASYTLYRAVESSATYTKIASNLKGTSFIYSLPAKDVGKQITYALSAVGQDGRESNRITYVYVD